MMSTGTPAAGLPAGSSTRPVTVIRPGRGVIRLRRRARSILVARLGCASPWPAGCLHGFVLHRQGVSQISRAGGDGAEEQQGQRE